MANNSNLDSILYSLDADVSAFHLQIKNMKSTIPQDLTYRNNQIERKWTELSNRRNNLLRSLSSITTEQKRDFQSRHNVTISRMSSKMDELEKMIRIRSEKTNQIKDGVTLWGTIASILITLVGVIISIISGKKN